MAEARDSVTSRPKLEDVEARDRSVVLRVPRSQREAELDGGRSDQGIHDPEAVSDPVILEQADRPPGNRLIGMQHRGHVRRKERLDFLNLDATAASLQELHHRQGGDGATRVRHGCDETTRPIVTAKEPDENVAVESYVSNLGALSDRTHRSTFRRSRRRLHIPKPVGTRSARPPTSIGRRIATDLPRYVITTSRPRRTSSSTAEVLCLRSFAVAFFKSPLDSPSMHLEVYPWNPGQVNRIMHGKAEAYASAA